MKRLHGCARQLGAFATLCAFAGAALAQNAKFDWEHFGYAHKQLHPSDLKGLDQDVLEFTRGIIFGKHGRVFRDATIQEYLEDTNWYKPKKSFRNSELNDTERKNLDIVREAEANVHRNVQPGDLRFWQNKKFSKEKLGEHTLNELHIMSSEIEAIHGKRFDNEPAIQTYFEERYWYRPGRFDPKSFSKTELENLETLRTAEKVKRSLAISPGDMYTLQESELKEKQLKGLTLYELRLLRNEIYALRGHEFKTPWLADYYGNQEWYKPLPKGKEPKLTKTDQKNVATILKFENGIHEGLTSKLIEMKTLDGLYLEDARKLRFEIEARHGKAFKDKWIQGYFASLPWYKKNPVYSKKSLSALEKRNMATIEEYEGEAVSLFHLTEG